MIFIITMYASAFVIKLMFTLFLLLFKQSSFTYSLHVRNSNAYYNNKYNHHKKIYAKLYKFSHLVRHFLILLPKMVLAGESTMAQVVQPAIAG